MAILDNFERIQTQIGDIPGESGIALRRARYAPYFLRMGQDVVIEERCRFTHPDRIVLEDDVRINVDGLIYGSGGVRIGRHARIGPRCFIHSSNHEIAESPKAFHERGYVDAAVTIGDNCLLSANVSILPGTQLDNDTFVACGAVVTKAIYSPASRLLGVPAREQRIPNDTAFGSVIDIALVVPSQGAWAAFAWHLLSTLGLPQVGVVMEGEPLGPGVHAAIVLGEPDWNPLLPDGVVRWTLYEGDSDDSSGSRQTLRLLRYAHGARGRRDVANADEELAQAMFWLMTRLRKGAGSLALPDFLEWVVTLQLLCSSDAEPPSFVALAVRDLVRRRPAGLPALQKLSNHGLTEWLAEVNLRCRRAIASPAGRWRLRLGTLRTGLADAWRTRGGKRTRWKLLGSALSRRTFDKIAAAPVFILAKQLGRKASEAPRALRRESLPLARAHDQLVQIISAHMLGDKQRFGQLDEQLRSSAWSVEGMAFPRVRTGSESLCYSPLVLAWLYLRRLSADPTYRIPPEFGVTVESPLQLHWKVFGNGQYLDAERRLISRSLQVNWDRLHSATCPPGVQFVLEPSAYFSDIGWLEAQWLEVFRRIQFSRRLQLLRLRPWPHGYNAAVSIRYDVDRPVSLGRITQLVRLQAQHANAPCASWYYFVQDPALETQAKVLQRHWQGRGIHALRCEDARPGWGVTHHSAPTSDYWQGSQTVTALAAAGARYGEFLAAGFGTPRPAWLHEAYANAALQAFWVTPLHFPLEGSTHDTTLEYFDQLLSRFRERLQSGGHAIIGSHPDLNQDILIELLQRESRPGIWFVTIADAVSRCQQVMGYGQIGVQMTDGVVQLRSSTPIADLSVEIWKSGAESPELRCLQLKAGVPRALPW